ncbi:unnamed protein product [Clonostachys solani]|uniref:Uncharacterized protein n=1 Tax=Clonostachys solani TaxID=160281 RepID=A0A9N9ZF75_9HYPO|nr:unnamed protein product [Clonostachys solani]
MRFNITSVCALLSIATQIVSAEPARAWDDPQNTFWYATSAAVCGYGANLCSTHGQKASADTLATAAFCCTMTGIAAVASRTEQLEDAKKGFEKTKKTFGDAATFVKEKAGQYKTKAGVFFADCSDKFCRLVNRPRPPTPTRPNGAAPKRRNYQRNQRRSGHRKMKRSSPTGTRIRSRDLMSMGYYY